MSIYSSLQAAPKDPILGMTETFNADPAPVKVNLGVGVYQDDTGKTPLMACVQTVEQDLAERHRSRGYLPMDGLAAFNSSAQALVFGENSAVCQAGRVVSQQSLAGTGALRVGANLLKMASPDAQLWLSTPSWENHELIFTRAGFELGAYRYYDRASGGVDVEGMLEDLAGAAPGTIVVLHACCHNPTGCDLTPADWDRVVQVVVDNQLVPFIDMAYQGLSHSVDEDRYPVTAFADSGIEFLVANSFSKTFGLYGERIGAIHFVAADGDRAKKILSQTKLIARSMYSNPPTQGAAIVAEVLTTPELKALWAQELNQMKDRMKQMRQVFRAGLEAAGVDQDLSFITSQAGMFSYSGMSVAQMQRLRSEFHVYGLDSGRLCIAAMNSRNMDFVVESVATVLKG
ncbi:MAG: aspartate/tyrosine/aromatic aminotransferase [Propionibacteriaceae bacterium]|nr:aspartate/tyrosine/aromatic aminotransferase [Propionibacteriaceae bacterium]